MGFQSVVCEPLGEALPATCRARDVGLPVDERDACVTQSHQMVDRKSHPELVGAEHSVTGPSRGESIDEYHGDLLAEGRQCNWVRPGRDVHDHAVHLALPEGFHVAAFLLQVVLRAAEQHRVASFCERILGPFEQLREDGVHDVGHDHADGHGPATRQRPCRETGSVAELLDGTVDSSPGGGCDGPGS